MIVDYLHGLTTGVFVALPIGAVIGIYIGIKCIKIESYRMPEAMAYWIREKLKLNERV